MNPDHILTQMRQWAANATRAAKNPGACADPHCANKYRAEAMAACFTELDASLSYGGKLPTEWTSRLVPGQRGKRH